MKLLDSLWRSVTTLPGKVSEDKVSSGKTFSCELQVEQACFGGTFCLGLRMNATTQRLYLGSTFKMGT